MEHCPENACKLSRKDQKRGPEWTKSGVVKAASICSRSILSGTRHPSVSSLALRRSQTGRGQTDICLLIHSFVPSPRKALGSSPGSGAGLLSLPLCSRESPLA